MEVNQTKIETCSDHQVRYLYVTTFYAVSASEKGLLTVMILTAICTVIFSFQMTVDEPSMLNAISMTILFAFVRTLFYIVKSMVSLLQTFENIF